MTDEELMAKIASGDEEALALLYRRHAGWLAARLSTSCPTCQLAEEVLQDTFLGVWRAATAYRAEGDVAAWLWGIARRRLASATRRERRHIVLPEAWRSGQEAPAAEDVAQLIEARIDARQLRSAVAGLPGDQRRVVEAVHLQGESVSNAARAAGVAPGTVKSRLSRARARLRDDLQKPGEKTEPAQPNRRSDATGPGQR